MARVNITIRDDLLEQARTAGLSVSRVSAGALSQELDRRAKIAALDSHLRELEVELGSVSISEQVAAQAWADKVLDGSAVPTTGGRPLP